MTVSGNQQAAAKQVSGQAYFYARGAPKAAGRL
jgi:hypothetical protein